MGHWVVDGSGVVVAVDVVVVVGAVSDGCVLDGASISSWWYSFVGGSVDATISSTESSAKDSNIESIIFLTKAHQQKRAKHTHTHHFRVCNQ